MNFRSLCESRIAFHGLLLAGMAIPAVFSFPTTAVISDRDNLRWVSALEPGADRYRGIPKAEIKGIQEMESRYRELLDELTVIDGMGSSHGAFHRTKPDREARLWALLKGLPRYPAAPRLILATLDDVYLGHHNNGWWGTWWHWPYLDCIKAIALADRLAKDYPEMEEESLWTKIHCARIKGWAEGREYQGRESQELWKSDPRLARAWCAELLKKFPGGKYAPRATRLLAEEDLTLTLPHHPVMGRTRPGGGMAMTVLRHDGPEFVIDRSPR